MITGNPGCYSGPPDHACDCEVSEAECAESMGIWTDQCACEGGEPGTDYAFNNRFGEGSSISYSGQTARHALIAALKSYMGGLEHQLQAMASSKRERSLISSISSLTVQMMFAVAKTSQCLVL